LSIVAIVSKLLVLLANESGDGTVCVVDLIVEDITGYSGIGRGVGAFVGRIVGREECPTSIPEGALSVMLHIHLFKSLLREKKDILRML